MRIRLEFDISPKEVRQVLGLPDVEQLQREVIEAIRERMVAGVDGFDPLSLLRSLLSAAHAFPGFDAFQSLLRHAMSAGAGGGRPRTP